MSPIRPCTLESPFHPRCTTARRREPLPAGNRLLVIDEGRLPLESQAAAAMFQVITPAELHPHHEQSRRRWGRSSTTRWWPSPTTGHGCPRLVIVSLNEGNAFGEAPTTLIAGQLVCHATALLCRRVRGAGRQSQLTARNGRAIGGVRRRWPRRASTSGSDKETHLEPRLWVQLPSSAVGREQDQIGLCAQPPGLRRRWCQ